jgi:chaperonin GroEL
MQKIISSGKAAMDKIKAGVDMVANPVKSTISPNGRTVIISESFVSDYNTHYKPIVVSKDGYRVSQSISSTDPEIQAGVLMVQQACQKQMIDAGDATSTCALLTQALLDGGLKLIENGANPVEIVKGINAAVEYVVEELKKMSTPINGDVEKIRQVATVCSNNDAVIGNLIAEAFEKIGADGIINIEEAKGRETSIKIADGIKFGRGWASQYFITDKAKAECVLEKPFILIYDRPLVQLEDKATGSSLMPVLEGILHHQQQTGEKRPLMIFCDACDGEALATLTFNTNKGALQSCVVEMAFLGQHKREFLEDIAAATGGVFINELKGRKLDKIELSDFGQAQKIIVGKDETVIIGGLKDEKVFAAHAKSIKELEEKEEDTELKELLKKRYARINGAVAILSVGAITEVEMKEKKDRVDER